MSPPCATFPASELPLKIQEDVHGRRRKHNPTSDSHRVNLEACELLSMMQYKCLLSEPNERGSWIQCQQAERLFRRCKDRKGAFTVETTAWEGTTKSSNEDGNSPRAGSNGQNKGMQDWGQSWIQSMEDAAGPS